MTPLQRNPQAVSDADTEFLWKDSENNEIFLSRLRELGAYKIESIRSLRAMAGISLGDAKEIVHFSAAWADRRASDDAFHESLFEALEQINREEEVMERVAS